MPTQWIRGMAMAVMVTVLLVSNHAWAGRASNVPVFINNGSATGSLVDARYSNDVNQAIGCDLRTRFGQQSVECAARDATGRELRCLVVAGDANFARFREVARSISQASQLSFEARNGQCTSLGTFNSSVFLR